MVDQLVLKLKMFQGADQHCTVGLLSKMAVDRLSSFFIHLYSHLAPNNFPTTFFFLYNTHDRTLNSSLADAREAFINVCVDAIERWKLVRESTIFVFVYHVGRRGYEMKMLPVLSDRSNNLQVQCINRPWQRNSLRETAKLPLC